jgi:DNA-binding PadR family transcriptional regulator
MEIFRSLFGKLLVFVYHCYDRIVLQGHLPLLSREGQIVYFFRDVRGEYPITNKVLAGRTNAYRAWVDSYARNHKIPVERAKKGISKEDHVRPYLERMEKQNRYGVYFIFQSMEQGSCFKSKPPKYPTDDPNYRIIQRDKRLYTHLYFYVRDEVLGPLAICVGTYLPFLIFYYVNGHHYIENELKREKVAYRKNDNAFLWVADPQALQAAADRLSEEILKKRLDHWTLVLGPKFSEKERKAVALGRQYSINQVEYCRNFIFKRNAPIRKIFERSCEMGLLNLTADKVAQIFGFRKHKRLRGKLYTMLEKIDHGHHVLRAYAKNAVARMYEKFSTFLRVEICVNRMKDFGLNKGLENLKRLRQILAEATERFAGFEAQALNVHVDFPLFQRLALPVTVGKTKIPGIKIHDTRLLRLMEVLLHEGTQIQGWRTAEIHEAITKAFGLAQGGYTLTQLRYDLRKLKAHGLLERQGKRYCYRLTEKGSRAALMFTLFHKRVCGPLANSLFDRRPDAKQQPASKIEAAYHKADAAIQQVIDQLAAAA